MIRNREAASLSRKKKKEYVTSLEEKINILQKENLELKIVSALNNFLCTIFILLLCILFRKTQH